MYSNHTPQGASRPPVLLKGRIAFVTGAGQGNGREIAIGLHRAGAQVVVTDIDAAAIEDTLAVIRNESGTGWAFQLDVTQPGDCLALAAHIGQHIGRVDLLVNNAGILIREGSDSPRAAANWQRVMDVNVNGTFNVTQAFLPALRSGGGTILNIASTAAFVGQAGSLAYSPSKGAIKMYTQSLASELAKDGVRVNALAPGLIETPMTIATRENPETLARFLNRIPMGRAGHPAELVGPAVFLSSSMSDYVTGVTLPVDGGRLA